MDNTVSIDTNVIVDSYQVVDDLSIIDEAVQVNIVDALFTSTQPDWNVNNPLSPYYIRHKPTKTSDFINDGSDGTSRYVQFSDIPGIAGSVIDVQVNFTGRYVSVVEDKIAKIDLSNYVQKELKTGSNIEYKVLSDNNLTDAEKQKISYLNINGDGSQALTNNGAYRDLYNILNVNGVTPNAEKSVVITPENLSYNNNTLKAFLDKTVTFNSAADKSITLDNNKFLQGKNTLGSELQLLGINSGNSIILGDNSALLNILSSGRITVNSDDTVAYTSDIAEGIADHNVSNIAHSDIRNKITNIETHMVMHLTNAEMLNAIQEQTLNNGDIVTPVDDGTYTSGKLYKYNNQAFILLSNYQVENLYSTSAPTTSTVGVTGQLCFDVINLKIWRCSNSSAPYDWTDITPGGSGGGGDPAIIQQILNNTRLISDVSGGFTAGNNYRLLDSQGIIPIERIPQAVLQGMTYGGSFDGNGIITASAQAQAIDGQVIDTVNKAYYKNYYFAATANYTLEGIQYIPGNFALSTGTDWVKIANSGQVVSVNGKDGNVVLDYTDVGAIGDDKLVSSWSSTTSNDNVPSEKLVKDSLDEKQDTIDSSHKLSADLVEDGTTNKVFTATEQTKLSGIESGAQVNAPNTVIDANYRHITVTNSSVSDGTNTFNSPDLTPYALAVDAGHTIEMSIDSSTYVVSLSLKNSAGTVLGTTQTIDLPLESVVVSGNYDAQTKEVVLTLQGGSTIRFSVADLVSGLQTEITSQNKLSADLVDDTNTTNKFVTAQEKTDIANNTAARHTHSNKAILDATTASYTTAEQTKLSGIETGAQVNTVNSVNTKTGAVVLDADDIDDTNTTHKFTTAADITKLAGIEAGAQVNTVSSVNTKTGAVVLDADDISDTNTTHKFATAEQLAKIGSATLNTTAQDLSGAVNELDSGKQDNLSSTQLDAVNSGITAQKLSDIETGIQNAEVTSNKTQTIDEHSTTTQYPSARAVYLALDAVESNLPAPMTTYEVQDVVTENMYNTIYTITYTITNGTYVGNAKVADSNEGGTASAIFAANEDYSLPSSITVTNATYTYNQSTGAFEITAATGNVTVTVTCIQV